MQAPSAGGVSGQLAWTVSITTVLVEALLWEVTASPSRSDPDMPPMLTDDPGTSVQLPLPGDVYALKAVPERDTLR